MRLVAAWIVLCVAVTAFIAGFSGAFGRVGENVALVALGVVVGAVAARSWGKPDRRDPDAFHG